MANDCVNVLIVMATKGHKKKLNEFIEKFVAGPDDLDDNYTGCGASFYDKQIPVPDELPFNDSLLSSKEKKRLIKKYGYSSASEFLEHNEDNVINCQFWSKCPSEHNPLVNGIRYQFETNWFPPLDYFEELQVVWPELNFKMGYCEPACSIMGFAGTVRVGNKAYFFDYPI